MSYNCRTMFPNTPAASLITAKTCCFGLSFYRIFLWPYKAKRVLSFLFWSGLWNNANRLSWRCRGRKNVSKTQNLVWQDRLNLAMAGSIAPIVSNCSRIALELSRITLEIAPMVRQIAWIVLNCRGWFCFKLLCHNWLESKLTTD